MVGYPGDKRLLHSLIHFVYDSALHIACKRGVAISTVKFLLSKDKDVRRVKNKNGYYPVDLAEFHGLAADIPELYVPEIHRAKTACSDSLGSTLSSTESYKEEEFHQEEFLLSFH